MTLRELSDQSVSVVALAAAVTVQVDGRRGYPVSGTVFDSRHLLALEHTVERDEEIRVVLPDGTEAEASVRGRDGRSDLVLLSLDQALSGVASPAPSPPGVGEIVIAVGRPSGAPEAALGIVSSVGGPLRLRGGGSLETYIETDIMRMPGFSGGPVVDADGRVVGITMNSMRAAGSFAIGASGAWAVARILAERGSVPRAYLGIRSQPSPIPQKAATGRAGEQQTGLLVVGVEAGSAAERAGVLIGDIVVGLGGRAVRDHEDLLGSLTPELVGKAVVMELVRGGALVSVDVTPQSAS